MRYWILDKGRDTSARHVADPAQSWWSWEEGSHLASLLSWSQESRRRALGLIPISDADVDSLERAVAGRWSDLVARLREACARATGNALAVIVDDSSDIVLTATSVPVDDIRDELLSDVEEALEPERRKWLSPPPGALDR